MITKQCYCESGRVFDDCCAPILAGSSPASTAEALMRSRYTANVLTDTAYLLKTWHPGTRPQSIDGKSVPSWCGLAILAVQKGQQGDDQGMVEFRALYRSAIGISVLHERSRFLFEDDSWFYVDGELIEAEAIQSGKTGRNEPCPCGSGKKYKKCCLK